MPRDLSGQAGNPTSWIQDNYETLMSMTDPDEIVNFVVDGVRPLVGRSFSDKNFRKLVNDIGRAAEKGRQSLQFYLTNYLLAGSGMSPRAVEDTQSIASMISEDIDDPTLRLTYRQQQLKRLVESYGYSVTLVQ